VERHEIHRCLRRAHQEVRFTLRVGNLDPLATTHLDSAKDHPREAFGTVTNPATARLILYPAAELDHSVAYRSSHEPATPDHRI